MAAPRRHEHYLPDNVPTPHQLLRLASVGVSSAVRRNRLRQAPNRQERAHYFITETDYFAPEDTDVNYLTIRHRMAGRIGRKLLERTGPAWSLKYSDAYWVQRSDGNWYADLTRYRFEWDRRATRLAERQTRFFVPPHEALPEKSLMDEIDNFYIADDESALWQARSDLQVVTGGDCELLITDAETYYQQVDQLDKAA